MKSMIDTTNVLKNKRLMVSLAKEKPHAFMPLYEYYFPRVYSYELYRVEDPDIATDITAQTFEKAYTKLDRYRPERAAFSTWLFMIATNAIRNHKRWRWARNLILLDYLRDVC